MPRLFDQQAIHDSLRLISAALSATSLYSIEHQQVRLLIPKIRENLAALLAQQPELTFLIVKDDLLFDGKPLERTPHTERIARLLYSRNIGFIRFYQGIEVREVDLLLQVAAGLSAAVLFNSETPHIDYGEIDTPDESEETRQIFCFEELTAEELQSIGTFYEKIGDRTDLDIREVSSIIAGFASAFQQEANPLLALVPLREEDEYSFTHSLNVAILNLAQGNSLGLKGQLLHDVGIAGMLHDSGKIFIDKEILRKPAGLSDEEWRHMQKHPALGAQYLLGQEGIPALAIITAFEHHMRYDKKGYPEVSSDWQINLCTQMTMISDTFDALRTRRTYKEPWDFAKISGRMLELVSNQLNPHLTLNFLSMMSELGEQLIESGISLSAGAPQRTDAELAARHVCE